MSAPRSTTGCWRARTAGDRGPGRRPGDGGAATARRHARRQRRTGVRRGGRGLRRPARRSVARCRRALLPRPHLAQRRDVRPPGPALHLSQPRHPRLRQHFLRTRGRCCRGVAAGGGHRGRSGPRGPASRPKIAPVALASGPGNLCAALGISMADNGAAVFGRRSPVTVLLGDPVRGVAGPRVGVSRAADRPWRFWLPGYAEVSSYRRSPRAPQPGDSD